MVEQATGATIAAVLLLSYLLIVECLMAAAILLGRFIVFQLRGLRSLLPEKSPEPVAERATYQLGGALRRWE